MCVFYIKASADSPRPLEDTGKTVALKWNGFRSLGEHMEERHQQSLIQKGLRILHVREWAA